MILAAARRKFPLCALCFALCALHIPVVFASDIKPTSPEERLSADASAAEVPPARQILGGSPQKIVSINLCSDELLLRLVEPDRVAALTKFSADPEVSTVAAEAQGLRRIAGDIESVLTCQPDLLLSGRFSNKETVRFFEKSGVPVLVFSVPRSFEDIYAHLERLSKAVGEQEKGDAIIRNMKEELDGLKKMSRPRRAVFLQSDNYVPGAGTFENAVMEAAGLRNIAVELGITDYGRMGLEELIRSKPDVIIFSSEQKNSKTVRGEMLDHPAIKKALPEVKTVTIPTLYLNCGSPVSVEAVRILVKETAS